MYLPHPPPPPRHYDCLRGQLRKRTTDPEAGSSNPHEYQQQKKGKGKSEITGEQVSEEVSEEVSEGNVRTR